MQSEEMGKPGTKRETEQGAATPVSNHLSSVWQGNEMAYANKSTVARKLQCCQWYFIFPFFKLPPPYLPQDKRQRSVLLVEHICWLVCLSFPFLGIAPLIHMFMEQSFPSVSLSGRGIQKGCHWRKTASVAGRF